MEWPVIGPNPVRLTAWAMIRPSAGTDVKSERYAVVLQFVGPAVSWIKRERDSKVILLPDSVGFCHVLNWRHNFCATTDWHSVVSSTVDNISVTVAHVGRESRLLGQGYGKCSLREPVSWSIWHYAIHSGRTTCFDGTSAEARFTSMRQRRWSSANETDVQLLPHCSSEAGDWPVILTRKLTVSYLIIRYIYTFLGRNLRHGVWRLHQ